MLFESNWTYICDLQICKIVHMQLKVVEQLFDKNETTKQLNLHEKAWIIFSSFMSNLQGVTSEI